MKKLLLSAAALFSLQSSAQIIPLDETFNTGAGPDQAVSVIKQLPDGKLLIGGQFNNYDGVEVTRLARLNSDGSMDAGFNPDFEGYVDSMIIEADGKLVVSGFMSGIVRLNADGSLDSTFNPPAMGGGTGPYNIIKQDNKYVVIGEFTTVHPDGIMYNDLIRLNYDGSIDPTFVPTDFSNSIGFGEMILLQDGKLLMYGNFDYYNGVSVNNIMRLNVDGSLDTSFNVGSGSNSTIRDAKQQADGKLIVSGYFSSWNGQAKRDFVRLHQDGTIDETFNYTPGPGLPEDGLIASDMVLQPNGQILAAGWFRDNYFDIEGTLDGSVPTYMVKLNSDGSTDNSFTTSFDVTNGIYDLEVQSDGKILAGGWFTAYGETPQMNIVRLDYNALSLGEKDIFSANVYPNPVSEILYIDNNELINASVSVVDITGKTLSITYISNEKSSIDMSAYAAGVYIVTIQTEDKIQSVKVIKN